MVTGILIISTFAYHIGRSKEENLFNYAYRQNTSISINSILRSRERSLNQSLEDTASWDMMVSFIIKPDTLWARDNLGSTRKTLDLDFIQVYDLGYKRAWAVFDPENRSKLEKALTKDKLQIIFREHPTCHFFEYSDAGLLELYGSIIVPSLDIARKTTAKGYMFFGKIWDKQVFTDLENSSNSFIDMHNLEVTGVPRPHAVDNNSQEIPVFLQDYSGKNIVRLDFNSKSLYKADIRLFYLFTLIPFALAFVVLILFYILIRRWITLPVRKITKSLDRQDDEGLSQIGSDNPEFHLIARLVSDSFGYRKNLEKEVAERKNAEERISKFAEELQETNVSKDKFFSILAHDLKSPFHYLLGYSELLKSEYPTLNDEERKKFISIIHSNSQRLYNLLENLLEWSRIQTGRIDFEMEIFDFSKELKQGCETIRPSAHQKNIRFESDSFDQAIVKADRNMIRSAIHNILTNAVKYTPNEGLITIKTKTEETSIEVSVQDSGIGMNHDDVAKLFRIDVSFSRPGTNKEPGTGLGLILTKEFIEKNGGSVFVESEPDKGSLFRITLPLYKA